MGDVTLAHPNLPGQLITVPEEAVPTHRASGWTDDVPAPEPVDYSGWTKDELIAEADSRGLPLNGTKADLIARLDGNDVSATEPDQPAEEPQPEEPAEA